MSRILPADRLRYAATVAGLLAVYGLLVVLDAWEWLRGRRATMDEGRWPWEKE